MVVMPLDRRQQKRLQPQQQPQQNDLSSRSVDVERVRSSHESPRKIRQAVANSQAKKQSDDL